MEDKRFKLREGKIFHRVFSTYVGGSLVEQASSIAVDAAGNSYITGNTNSLDFPTTPGAFDTEKTTFAEDVFVTKLNATGTAIIYSTYFGGSNREAATVFIAETLSPWTQQETHPLQDLRSQPISPPRRTQFRANYAATAMLSSRD